MLSIAAGYDPGYLTRSVGRGAENYYLSAIAEHGEPPGIWWGLGAEALGLEPGSLVDPAIMEKLYSTFLDPRDPGFLDKDIPDEEKGRLGRRPSQYKSAETILAGLLAAEPEATAERAEELRIQAKKEARSAVYFFDLTFSPTKSVSLLHAGLQASAVQAREAGRIEQAEAYEKAAAAVWDAVLAGATASLAYTRDHAGAARAGYHGVTIEGRSTGRWVDAGQWVVSQFRQHTNREGEPQLHVHQAVLNRQLCADGQWRSLDSRAVHKVRAAAAAVGERVMEERLTRTLGVEWRSRPDGNGREVVGVTEAQIEAFSTRRVQVTADLERRIADYEAAHGCKPSARAIFQMAQHATKATKAGKRKASEAPSRAEELKEWERRTTEREIELLTEIPGAAIGRVPPERQAAYQARLADLNMRRVAAAAVREAQAAKSTFNRYEVIRYISRHLPDHLGGLPAERMEAMLEELADLALDPTGAAGARLLTAPERVEVPAELRRADGRSVYEAPCAQRYATAEQLDTETEVITTALGTGAPRLDAAVAAASLGLEVASDGRVSRSTGATSAASSLRLDQAAAVYGIATSGRQTDVLVGPAGAGKSYTVAKLAEIWREQTGGRVVGLTLAQNAANVLKGEGLDSAYNIEQWLRAVKRGTARLEPGQLVVVDEASMVGTDYMRRIHRLAARAGAKVLLAGDQEQLGAPGVGGIMRQLTATAGAYELVDVQRMREQWEREASLRLRDGDAQVLGEYDRRGRIREGTQEEMEEAACQAYLADLLAGRRTLLLVSTNEKASQLSARVRAELVAYGVVSAGGVRLRDGNAAGIGDLIMARQNDHKLKIGDRSLTNRDVLKVEAVGAGVLVARLLDKNGRAGEQITLRGEYVANHIELAYAGTVHAAQGRTVDTGHSLVDDQVSRRMLYVMLSRATDGNYAYAAATPRPQADLRSGPDQAAEDAPEVQGGDGLTVLAAALERVEDDQTALEAARAEAQRVTHMGHLGSMWLDVIREYSADAYISQAEARGILPAEEAARLRTDEAKGTLGRLLRQLEMSGRDAAAILGQAITQRELDSADSPAQVLHWRITKAAETAGVNAKTLEPSEAQIRGTWMDRTPDLANPEITRFAGDLAMEMERRTLQLGERAAQRPPTWLIEALGEIPPGPVERGEWIDRAGRVMAYREQYGYEVTSDAIGTAPSRAVPEQRTAWYAAYDALGRPEQERDVAAATLGELWVMRAAYERDARWAPPYVADDLKATSIAQREHAAEAVRLRAQARATADKTVANGLWTQAQGLQAMAAELEEQRVRLAEIDAARQAWHTATQDARVMAMRADAELRRRPDVRAELLPPLHKLLSPFQKLLVRPAAEAEGREAPARHEQLTLDLGIPEPETSAQVSIEAPETPEPPQAVAQIQGQEALDLYGEAGMQERTAAAILQARAARAIAAGRAEAEDLAAERLRRSQDERLAAERDAERETERLAAERADLERREAERAQQAQQAAALEFERDEDLSL
ncbi:MobF family relaxase [Streptosporangium saharense]|uniref:Conjugative relaxase-like TrwC/TraI family protein n=1 Tax=Streptosporangium saharense TaxID=1706840 RepID=A0A7W7VSA1_9ACTN|nr:MobF family relaxase [Streptosporangium saharense]MBB4920971.1 conjugative relaxase-like TrwC/TraI family protein [Streptosporangium saharense]